MPTREVYGRIQRVNGNPWAGALVRFRLAPGSYIPASQVPEQRVEAITDAEGDFTIPLWANSNGDGPSRYIVTVPSGEHFSFVLPSADGSPVALSTLRALGLVYTDPGFESVLTYLAAQPEFVGSAALLGHTTRGDNPHGVTASQVGALGLEGGALSGPLTGPDGGMLQLPSGAKAPNLAEAINLYSEKYTGLVTPEGDWRPALIAAFTDGMNERVPVDLGGEDLLISNTITLREIRFISHGAAIRRRSPSAGPVFSVAGTLDTVTGWQPLTASAARGDSYLVCPGMAGKLAPGDVVYLKSNKWFVGSHPRIQGEVHTVAEEVSAGLFQLNETLEDTYLVADGATVMRLALPGIFQGSGRLTLDNEPTDPLHTNVGLSLLYGVQPEADLIGRNTSGATVAVYDSYAPRFQIHQTKGKIGGHAALVMGATSYGHFSGVGVASRHVYAAGSTSSSLGVPHETTVSMVGINSHGGSVFDTHLSTGRTRFVNCMAIGGEGILQQEEVPGDWNVDTFVPTAVARRGYSLSGRSNHLINSGGAGFLWGCAVRSGVGDDLYMEELEIKNVRFDRCHDGVFLNNAKMRIGHLDVDGLYCNRATSFDSTVAALHFAAIKQVDRWSIKNINAVNQRAVLHSWAPAVLPREMRVEGGSCVVTNGGAQSHNAIHLGAATTKVVQVSDFDAQGIAVVGSATNAIDLIEQIGCSSRGGSNWLGFARGPVGVWRVLGGEYGDLQVAASPAIRVSPEGSIGFLDFQPSRLYGSNLTHLGRLDGTLSSFRVGGDTAGLVSGSLFTGVGAASPLEIVEGTPQLPRHVRGAGSPEGVVAAPFACVYTQRDAAVMWFKSTASGNTGWVRMTLPTTELVSQPSAGNESRTLSASAAISVPSATATTIATFTVPNPPGVTSGVSGAFRVLLRLNVRDGALRHNQGCNLEFTISRARSVNAVASSITLSSLSVSATDPAGVGGLVAGEFSLVVSGSASDTQTVALLITKTLPVAGLLRPVIWLQQTSDAASERITANIP